MQRGDHIKIFRLRKPALPYSHHGVYVGSGRVIHYTGEVGSKRGACVVETSLEAFLDGQNRDHVQMVGYSGRNSSEVAVCRARSRIGEAEYSLAFQNCEHFATWCVTGTARSKQTRLGAAVLVVVAVLFGKFRVG